MGVTYDVTCLDCGDEAPEVGDFGYIGFPSLCRAQGSRFVPNFGFVYEGLVALGMRTADLEDVRAFLQKHRGHALDLSCEGEAMFDEEEDADEGAGAGEELPDAPRPTRKAFVTAYYEATCPRCQQSVRSEHEDVVLPFETRTLAKQDAKQALAQAFAENAFDRWDPFVDIQGVSAFLHAHAAHGLQIGLVRKA